MPRCAAAERQQQVENRRRVVEPVAVQVADLTHAVAHGLRVHVQLGGHGVTAALVQQPGQETSPEVARGWQAGGRPAGASAAARRSSRASGSARTISSARWSAAVHRVVAGSGPQSTIAAVRAARSYDERTSDHGRGGPSTACLPASSRVRRRRSAASTSGTRSRVSGWPMPPSSASGRSSPTTRMSDPSDTSTLRTCAEGTRTAVRVVGGVQSARAPQPRARPG